MDLLDWLFQKLVDNSRWAFSALWIIGFTYAAFAYKTILRGEMASHDYMLGAFFVSLVTAIIINIFWEKVRDRGRR